MGQTIEITGTAVIDHVLVVDTDRTLAGQDGVAFSGAETARLKSTFPARLAIELFEADDAIDHVFVMSNAVSVRRPVGWDDEQIERTVGIISGFFRFYPD